MEERKHRSSNKAPGTASEAARTNEFALIADLDGRVTRLEKELESLREWKASASASLSRWHTLGELLQKRYPVPLGEDVPSALARLIERDWQDWL